VSRTSICTPGLLSIALPLCVALLPRGGIAQDNVLIIVADDLGTDYVGAYGEGAAPAPTPNIDALAAQGVLFRNAWANPTCSPTRASFQTGRHGYRTGIGSPESGVPLSLDETTIPEALDENDAGYAHGYFGKWHLASGGGGPDHPNDQGWSQFTGLLGGGVGDYYHWSRNVNGVTAISHTYTSTQIVDDALAWLSTESDPWVCVVAFNAPHTPFHEPPAELHTQVLVGGNPNQNPAPYYRAAVEAMDTEIGRLLTTLGNELASTNVIFFGDNGTPRQVSVAPFTADHAKGSPYEGGVGVPFLVSGPAVTSPGREVDALVHAVDVFATVGDLVGTPLDVPVVRQDSISFAPYLSDPSQLDLRASVYAESFQGDPDEDGFAVARGERYKLIRHYDAIGVVSEEFYDLVATPFETANLLPALSFVEQQAYAALDAHILSVRDTTGGFEAIGTSTCIGSNGIPQISGTGAPSIGSSYVVNLAQAPGSAVTLLAIGRSDAYAATLGIALPFDLSIVGAGAGCNLYTSTEWLFPLTTSSAGTVALAVPLPNLPVLIGGSIYHSWIIADPIGVTATAGLRVTFGD